MQRLPHFTQFSSAICISLMSLGLVALGSPPRASREGVLFGRDVLPILSERCFACHGPDDSQRKTALRFDTREGIFGQLGDGGYAIVRGDTEKSELFQRITSEDSIRRMPPAYLGHEKLPATEIEVIRLWIEQGSPYEEHWAFTPPQRPQPPRVKDPRWPRNSIDYFVLHRLEKEGLTPSPEADRRALIRRASLDLTGLPPTLRGVAAFVNDTSKDAYEKVVDCLLASPRYGERMAIRWLDAARYADTNGYSNDGLREMWRWRDWVIDAFNANKPFNEFTIEQIAGDMLPDAGRPEIIATAFNRNHRTSGEGGIIEEEFRTKYVVDRVETTSTVWLGLTTGCARCHDHKYDPIKQKEFYQLFAYFNNVPERGQVYNFGKRASHDQSSKPLPRKTTWHVWMPGSRKLNTLLGRCKARSIELSESGSSGSGIPKPPTGCLERASFYTSNWTVTSTRQREFT